MKKIQPKTPLLYRILRTTYLLGCLFVLSQWSFQKNSHALGAFQEAPYIQLFDRSVFQTPLTFQGDFNPVEGTINSMGELLKETEKHIVTSAQTPLMAWVTSAKNIEKNHTPSIWSRDVVLFA